MNFTIDSSTHCLSRTFATHKVFCSKSSLSLLLVATLFKSSKVWTLTFETFIIAETIKSIFWQVIEVIILWIKQSFIIINPFKPCSLNRFTCDLLFHLPCLFDKSSNGWMISLDLLLTSRTFGMEEGDARTSPLHLYLLQQAVNVEDVFASELNTGLVTDSRYETDRAETT